MQNTDEINKMNEKTVAFMDTSQRHVIVSKECSMEDGRVDRCARGRVGRGIDGSCFPPKGSHVIATSYRIISIWREKNP